MKNKSKENYLEKIPVLPEIKWTVEDNLVTLHKENTGLMNKIMQKLIFKPETSHIHLDKFGSFVWQITDGKKNIIKLGEEVKTHFGDEAEPLYERLAKFFQILDSYNLIKWN